MLLEEFLKPLGISQSEFAIRLGVSFARLNDIIRGKRGLTNPGYRPSVGSSPGDIGGLLARIAARLGPVARHEKQEGG
jgi:hypothetical protein